MDRTRPYLTFEQQSLVDGNFRLARKLSRPFRLLRLAEAEDFEMEAYLALCLAARAWRPALGVPFAGFARLRIVGALKRAWKKAVRRGLTGEDRDRGPAPAVGPLREVDREAPPRGEDDGAGLETRILPLPERQRAICRLVYGAGRTEAEAAAELGIGPRAAAGLHRRAVLKLRATAAAGA